MVTLYSDWKMSDGLRWIRMMLATKRRKFSFEHSSMRASGAKGFACVPKEHHTCCYYLPGKEKVSLRSHCVIRVVRSVCNETVSLCGRTSPPFSLTFDAVAPDDVAQFVQVSQASISGIPGARISEPIVLRFQSQTVSISFQYMADLMQFIGVPRAYFDAVWQREPVDSPEFSENVLFKSSLELFEQLKAATMKSMNPPMVHGSCEVRILERSFGEAWRSMRRLVISSSAAEKNPRCMELFMPMSRVQVCREQDSRQVLIKWSDTRQERSTKTDGNYHPLFSYVYDHDNPNIGLSLHFRTQQQAEDFERVVLTLSLKPVFWWTQSGNPGQVYDVMDHTLNQKQYKAISILHTRLSWKYTNLYYLFRDTDYACEHSNLRVHFPRVLYADYISTHVDKLYQPDRPVVFSHCEKRIANFTIVFKEEQALYGFMTSLASAYELVFSRRAVSLTTKGKSLFGSSKSSKGETEVQLWRKGSTIQFASRWKDLNIDRWLTMSVPPGVLLSSDRNRVDFPAVTHSRGTVLNMATIVATAPKNPNKMRKTSPITVTFPSVKGAFLADCLYPRGAIDEH